MLLRTNIDLFKTIKALAGVNDFTTEENADLVSFAERRLNMAYNTSPIWDRYVVVSEKRILSSFLLTGSVAGDSYNNQLYYKYGTTTHTGTSTSDVFIPIDRSGANQRQIAFHKNSSGKWIWDVTSYTKTIADIVTISEGLVLATQQDTDEYESPTEVKNWGYVDSYKLSTKQIVSYNESFEALTSANLATNKNTINDFIRVHRKQSFLNNSSMEYDFYVDSNGANILNATNTEEIYVTYKKPIVNQTTGQIITSIDGSGNRTLNASGTEIPSEFFNYTAHGVYADFLRMDGQHDKAAFEEQKAELFLGTELERIDIINNNNSLNHKFSTYVNTSSR